MKRVLAVVVWFCLLPPSPPAGGRAGGVGAAKPTTIITVSLTDLRGQHHGSPEWKKYKAVVFLFLGTECPVSNGYSPEFERLLKKFAGQHVRFYGVHADPEVTAALAAKHADEYKLSFTILLDPTQRLTRQVGVKVVPEAAVLAPNGLVLYQGRIDDRYALDGKRREQPKTRDLELALAAILMGKSPPVARTAAFGCPLPEAKK